MSQDEPEGQADSCAWLVRHGEGGGDGEFVHNNGRRSLPLWRPSLLPQSLPPSGHFTTDPSNRLTKKPLPYRACLDSHYFLTQFGLCTIANPCQKSSKQLGILGHPSHTFNQ